MEMSILSLRISCVYLDSLPDRGRSEEVSDGVGALGDDQIGGVGKDWSRGRGREETNF